MPIFKEFDKIEHKGKVIGYNSQHRLYEVEYKDEDKEESYHNEIHVHKDQMKISPTKLKKPSKPKHANLRKVRKKKI